MMDISDVVSEASFWARRGGPQARPGRRRGACAIRKREYRSDLLEERIQELIGEGTLVIATHGTRVGELNGLAVLDLGDHAFGRPTRVSARVAIGRGSIASIEREIELSGPIHSKGVLILSGYLKATYAQEAPLPLAATLTFEQSYDEIEGDSASAAELVALLSALAELPLDQGIAMTGSVDQSGRIQAVGGVNHKIEGFFATCKARGLTGSQGVIVPATNVRNLMLEQEVVDAVRAGPVPRLGRAHRGRGARAARRRAGRQETEERHVRARHRARPRRRPASPATARACAPSEAGDESAHEKTPGETLSGRCRASTSRPPRSRNARPAHGREGTVGGNERGGAGAKGDSREHGVERSERLRRARRRAGPRGDRPPPLRAAG